MSEDTREHWSPAEPRLLWYASYGSNLSRDRFLCYIQGGTPRGATFSQVGCSVQELPRDDRPLTIPHRLYFAGRARGWENQGVCFIRRERAGVAGTLGRMYLIREDQFREVFLQENGVGSFQEKDQVPVEEAVVRGMSTFGQGNYATLLRLGTRESRPILTFTALWNENRVELVPPGPNYLSALARGLQECHGLSRGEMAEYFLSIPGISGHLSRSEVMDIIYRAVVG